MGEFVTVSVGKRTYSVPITPGRSVGALAQQVDRLSAAAARLGGSTRLDEVVGLRKLVAGTPAVVLPNNQAVSSLLRAGDEVEAVLSVDELSLPVNEETLAAPIDEFVLEEGPSPVSPRSPSPTRRQQTGSGGQEGPSALSPRRGERRKNRWRSPFSPKGRGSPFSPKGRGSVSLLVFVNGEAFHVPYSGQMRADELLHCVAEEFGREHGAANCPPLRALRVYQSDVDLDPSTIVAHLGAGAVLEAVIGAPLQPFESSPTSSTSSAEGMDVTVLVGDAPFNVRCDRGRATVQWLAEAAAATATDRTGRIPVLGPLSPYPGGDHLMPEQLVSAVLFDGAVVKAEAMWPPPASAGSSPETARPKRVKGVACVLCGDREVVVPFHGSNSVAWLVAEVSRRYERQTGEDPQIVGLRSLTGQGALPLELSLEEALAGLKEENGDAIVEAVFADASPVLARILAPPTTPARSPARSPVPTLASPPAQIVTVTMGNRRESPGSASSTLPTPVEVTEAVDELFCEGDGEGGGLDGLSFTVYARDEVLTLPFDDHTPVSWAMQRVSAAVGEEPSALVLRGVPGQLAPQQAMGGQLYVGAVVDAVFATGSSGGGAEEEQGAPSVHVFVGKRKLSLSFDPSEPVAALVEAVERMLPEAEPKINALRLRGIDANVPLGAEASTMLFGDAVLEAVLADDVLTVVVADVVLRIARPVPVSLLSCSWLRDAVQEAYRAATGETAPRIDGFRVDGADVLLAEAGEGMLQRANRVVVAVPPPPPPTPPESPSQLSQDDYFSASESDAEAEESEADEPELSLFSISVGSALEFDVACEASQTVGWLLQVVQSMFERRTGIPGSGLIGLCHDGDVEEELLNAHSSLAVACRGRTALTASGPGVAGLAERTEAKEKAQLRAAHQKIEALQQAAERAKACAIHTQQKAMAEIDALKAAAVDANALRLQLREQQELYKRLEASRPAPGGSPQSQRGPGEVPRAPGSPQSVGESKKIKGLEARLARARCERDELAAELRSVKQLGLGLPLPLPLPQSPAGVTEDAEHLRLEVERLTGELKSARAVDVSQLRFRVQSLEKELQQQTATASGLEQQVQQLQSQAQAQAQAQEQPEGGGDGEAALLRGLLEHAALQVSASDAAEKAAYQEAANLKSYVASLEARPLTADAEELSQAAASCKAAWDEVELVGDELSRSQEETEALREALVVTQQREEAATAEVARLKAMHERMTELVSAARRGARTG